MTIIPFTSPLGKIFTTYEHRVPLTGTGPFSIGEGSVASTCFFFAAISRCPHYHCERPDPDYPVVSQFEIELGDKGR